jgi:hypothetical protein
MSKATPKTLFERNVRSHLVSKELDELTILDRKFECHPGVFSSTFPSAASNPRRYALRGLSMLRK